MHAITIGFDTALRNTGFAVFDHEKDRFVSCGVIRNPTGTAAGMANLIADKVRAWKFGNSAVRVVGERPRPYKRTSRSTLHGVESLKEVLAACPGLFDRLYYPSEWKGQVPKDIHTLRIKSAFREAGNSITVIPEPDRGMSDVWDAIGIVQFDLRKQAAR